MIGILQFSFLADVEGVTRLECPGCHTLMCMQCKMEWHQSLTCEARMEIYASATAVAHPFDTDWIASHFRNCPVCDASCEKSDDVNSVRCHSCNAHFCFECGVDYGLILGTGAHMHSADCALHRDYIMTG